MKTNLFLINLLLLSNAIFAQQHPLGQTLNGRSTGDAFGYSVSLSEDGNRLAIGAPYNDSIGLNTGIVEIYEFSAGSCAWEPLGSNHILSGNADHDYFGYSVSLSANGGFIAIGAPTSGGHVGYVEIYQLVQGDWELVGERIKGEMLTATISDRAGISISLSADGSIVAFGSGGRNDSNHLISQVEVWEFGSGGWQRLGENIIGRDYIDEFGISLSLSPDGSRMAIGARNNRRPAEPGYVRVLELNEERTQWDALGEDISGTEENDWFGFAVSMNSDGNILAVTVPQGESGRGYVNLYKHIANTPGDNGDDVWEPGNPIVGVNEGDHLGSSISLSRNGESLAIGSSNLETENGMNAGQANVYQNNGGWTLESLINGSAAGYQFGRSISISDDGNRIAVGATAANNANGRSGQVNVYSLSTFNCDTIISCCSGDNLIRNGDFEEGNTLFYSDYQAVINDNLTPGDFKILDFDTTSTICSLWEIEDHTHCFLGRNKNVMVINGQTQQSENINNILWQTNDLIQVEADSQYSFCFFAKSLNSCCFDITPSLKIEIQQGDGLWYSLSDWISLPLAGDENSACNWEQIETTFLAENEFIRIRIRLNELGNGDGNDLAIDDISLSKCE